LKKNFVCKKNLKLATAPNGNPQKSYRSSPAMWDHAALPAIRHRWSTFSDSSILN